MVLESGGWTGRPCSSVKGGGLWEELSKVSEQLLPKQMRPVGKERFFIPVPLPIPPAPCLSPHRPGPPAGPSAQRLPRGSLPPSGTPPAPPAVPAHPSTPLPAVGWLAPCPSASFPLHAIPSPPVLFRTNVILANYENHTGALHRPHLSNKQENKTTCNPPHQPHLPQGTGPPGLFSVPKKFF